jgi:hypothetical protein
MTTPNKQATIEKALEMWRNDQYKHGCGQLAEITPEYSELLENGYISSAKSELMRDSYRNIENSKDYVDFPESFKVDIAEAMKSGIFVSGTTGTGKSDIGMYIAEQLMRKGVIVVVFDPSQDWQNRSSIPQVQSLTLPYIPAIPQSSIVFDISRLSVLDRQRLIESFSALLYQHQASEQNRKEFFVFFEESSSYFKEGFMRAKRFANTSMLLSEGRNYSVRFGLITQFSALIDKTAMRYMRQRYFGFTCEPRDIEYIVRFFPKSKKQEIAETLRTLKSGEFVYMDSEGCYSKLYIEPFTSEKKPMRIAIPEPQLIPIEPPKQTDPRIAVSFISFMLWFFALIIALCR